MREVGPTRVDAICLISGSLVTGVLNLLLPHDDDDQAFFELVAGSEAWRWLHAGLVVGAVLVVVGLHGALRSTREVIPRLAPLGEGALWVGTTLLLAGLVVAGLAMDRAADDVVAAPAHDRSAAFFQAVGFDRLSYALYAAAFVTLLGAVPVVLGIGLRRSEPALGHTGVIVGSASAATGFLELVVRGTDTNAAATVASSLVILWCLVLGAFGVLRSRR